MIFAARPDVLNHNIETVARLQRAVRPSAGYARSLAVLARAGGGGPLTKSGLMVGLGESEDEVVATMADLRAVGVSIITVGQYLRPSNDHLPVSRYWSPEEFERLKQFGAEHRCTARGGVAIDPVELPRPGCGRGRCSGLRSGQVSPPGETAESRSGHEVLGLRVVADDGVGGLLGMQLEPLAHRHADALPAEELDHLGVVLEVRAGRVAPRVAPAPVCWRNSPASDGPSSSAKPSSSRMRWCQYSAVASAISTLRPWRNR